MLRCLLVARKENLIGVSTGMTGRSKNLDPTGFHLCYSQIIQIFKKKKQTPRPSRLIMRRFYFDFSLFFVVLNRVFIVYCTVMFCLCPAIKSCYYYENTGQISNFSGIFWLLGRLIWASPVFGTEKGFCSWN